MIDLHAPWWAVLILFLFAGFCDRIGRMLGEMVSERIKSRRERRHLATLRARSRPT